MARPIHEIAAGLEPARAGVPLRRGTRLHVIGIGGTAALAAALHARALGLEVSGYDQSLSASTAAMLDGAAIPIGSVVGELASQAWTPLSNGSLVAISKAITSTQPDHPEVVAARDAGAHLVSVQQVLADAAATRGGPLIGVAGTHGKTTSTGWVLDALLRSGKDLSAFVGGPLAAGIGMPERSPVHLGSEPGFVVEADEYGGNFDPYRADLALVLNVDWDHPDVFENRGAAVATFARWAAHPASKGLLFVNVGDPGGRELVTALRGFGSKHLFTLTTASGAQDADADIVGALHPRGGGRFGVTIAHLSPRVQVAAPALAELRGAPLDIGLRGAHNAVNAVGVAALAAGCGASAHGIANSLASFAGVGRRMEVRYDRNAITVLDDYGHHPTAIDATIATVREQFPDRTLILAIEPLTFHRTAALLEGLARSCSAADRVVVADIFAVRDLDTTSVTPADLASRIVALGTPATAPGSVLETAAALLPTIESGSVVLVMGGGRSTELAGALAEGLRSAP